MLVARCCAVARRRRRAAPIRGAASIARLPPTNDRRRPPRGGRPLPHRAPHRRLAQFAHPAGRSRMPIALHGLALRKASDAISPLNAVVEPGCCRTPPLPPRVRRDRPSSSVRRQPNFAKTESPGRRAPRARARGFAASKPNAGWEVRGPSPTLGSASHARDVCAIKTNAPEAPPTPPPPTNSELKSRRGRTAHCRHRARRAAFRKLLAATKRDEVQVSATRHVNVSAVDETSLRAQEEGD